MMKVEVDMRILLYWMPAPKEVDPVSMELTTDESRNATISGEVLDALIATVFVDPAYRRDALLFTSSTPLNFTVHLDKSDGYQLVPANPYFSGFATLTLRAVLQDANIPVGDTSASRRHFDALPNVTVVVTVELFIAPVATAPVVNATAVRSTAPLGTAIVLSIGAISLRDVDGSEELSVELATEMDLDAVATALSRVVYALPIPTSTDGIMDADVMLIAADNLFTGRFSVSLTATSRELYFTNTSNASSASSLFSAEVGWMAEPTVYYTKPLAFWLRGQKDTPVSIALSNIRGRLQAETPSSDTNKLVYGPCRLAWDTDRVQAVLSSTHQRT
ncbi:uncharacterized protein PITG_19642 [Phytophthora infestans T30-4]|uniref:Uncharacterized protein n=1 Tax=Phytophthora infestans (strain T30-4) TaxID=403677 RepID=D0P0H4_PHYIT|nr:uncharacterized protein PITG_19642 [Phytophthora infestans T30-4]EEY52936.1 conserved hypothetical protein [Phytophthora infestans T30-4]|eukprot:XP_002896203.1 conserved hypothetical protein [Phytophthora infestans T30-4]